VSFARIPFPHPPLARMEVGTRSAAMPPAMDTYKGAFTAIGRLFHACSAGWQGFDIPESVLQSPTCVVASRDICQLALADLADGPYFNIATQLGVEDLSRADAACRLTRDLNRSHGGPWWVMGRRNFTGLELDGDTIFDPAEDEITEGHTTVGGRKLVRVDWKCRYARFAAEVKMFRTPFSGTEITTVQQADEIAYCCHKLRSDILQARSAIGVYVEVKVLANPDNVSLAVVDFEAGGCSSVTFSPDTGAIIRERKIREAPRKVEGTYIQPLTTITSGQGFEGSMGLYLQGGLLAFYRQHVERERGTEEKATGLQVGAWECTGFVTDLSWAEGKRLTPCLAFRDVGDYHLRLTRIDAHPPVMPAERKLAFDNSLWRSLDWDATEQDEAEM